MDERISDGVSVKVVLLSAEAGETLLVDKGLQRVEGSHQHVNTHVEFVPFQQQRVGDVLLHHDIVDVVEFAEGTDYLDASTAGLANRLHNPKVLVFVQHLLLMELHA